MSETSVSFIHCCRKSKFAVFLYCRHPETKIQEHQFTSLLLVKIHFGKDMKHLGRTVMFQAKGPLLWTCLSAKYKTVK